ncbi:MAG TPA: hypothetical protein VLD85_05155 [Anaeromyxobacteraceae bacterium]|nr:hypothetical protein [Anaeromyxobacteraceae bacterium]
MKALRSILTASLLALALVAVNASAQEGPKFEFHGFVVGSLYIQDQTFANGQGQGLLVSAPAPANTLKRPGSTTDKTGTFLGGDARETRPIFILTGPKAFGAVPRAYMEFDLFGNSNAGALGYESPNLRLRQAFGELKFGNTTFDAGQHSAQMLLVQIPASVAHIPNPVTFGAGSIGWRTIGFRVNHAMPMEGMTLEIGGELSHGKWADAAGATVYPGNAPNQISMAWASSMPQVVARVKASGKSGNLNWMGFLGGSYESIDLKGFGSTNNPNGVTLQDGSVKKGLASYAVTGGGALTFAPVTLMAQIYQGRGTAPMAGSLLNFGDIADLEYFAQLGVFATPQISIWAIYGAADLNKKDLQNWGNPAGTVLTEANTGLRQANQLYGGMLRFMDGGYALAAEYYANSTDWLLGNLAAPGGKKSTSAYQFIVSGGYFF